MDFKKLQQMQAALDAAILAEKATMTAEERFEKTLVALSVEIAEVANCAEHFKFWKDNKGKVDEKRFKVANLADKEYISSILRNRNIDFDFVDKKSGNHLFEKEAHRLTLIEECSDALHFVLSLANQFQLDITSINLPDRKQAGIPTLETMYLDVQDCLTNNYFELNESLMGHVLLPALFEYFHALGITDDELEQAYYDKNKINYERLANGY